MLPECVAKPVVGTHPTSHCHMLDACHLGCLAQLFHQYVNDGKLKTCRNILLMLLDEVGILSHPVSQVIQEGGLESAETVVEVGYLRLGKLICMGIALTSQTIDYGSSGIAEPHHLRAFVDSLTGSIVDCLSEHLHVVVCVHLDNLRVASAHQQTEERQRRS